MENERLKIYQGLVADGETKLSFVNFKKKFFGSQQAVVSFYQMLIGAQDPSGDFYYTDTIENFFKKYACDLYPTSNYCVQEGFPKCASRMGKVETSYLGFGKTYIEYTSGITAWGKPKVRLFQSSDGKTGPYEILSGIKKGGTGTYSCTSSGATLLGTPVMPTTSTGDATKTDNTKTNTDNKKTVPVAEKPAATTPAGNQAKIVTKSEKNPYVSGSDAIIY